MARDEGVARSEHLMRSLCECLTNCAAWALQWLLHADAAPHDLEGDALHALRGEEGMLLAGAAQNAVTDFPSTTLVPAAKRTSLPLPPRSLVREHWLTTPYDLEPNSRQMIQITQLNL